jgi:hypothetical protein
VDRNSVLDLGGASGIRDRTITSACLKAREKIIIEFAIPPRDELLDLIESIPE